MINKKILLIIIVLVLAILSCGISPKTETGNSPSNVPVMTELTNYNEVECPTGPPEGYSNAKCYRIDSNNIGTIVYKGSDIKALGLIVDVNYSDSNGLDKTADFVSDVVKIAGWNKDDILNATNKLADVDMGEKVVSGNIAASISLSSDENYILLVYSHK